MSEFESEKTSEELWRNALSLLRKMATTDQERSQLERYIPMFTSHGIEGNSFMTLDINVEVEEENGEIEN